MTSGRRALSPELGPSTAAGELQPDRGAGDRLGHLHGDEGAAGPGNLALCRDLGAEEVHDYTRVGPREIPGRFAGVLDAAGVDTPAYRSVLERGGRIVTPAGDAWLRMLPGAVTKKPRIRMLSAGPSRRDLAWLAARLAEGRLRPVVDHAYGVDEIRQAHRDAASPHASGRRIVVVG